MSQVEINNKKAIVAIRKAYLSGRLKKSQAEYLLSGVKI